MEASYQPFYRELSRFIAKECIFTDPSRTMAYGTDASCYRYEATWQVYQLMRIAHHAFGEKIYCVSSIQNEIWIDDFAITLA